MFASSMASFIYFASLALDWIFVHDSIWYSAEKAFQNQIQEGFADSSDLFGQYNVYSIITVPNDKEGVA